MLLCAVPILWAAISDYRRRIIPDWTWIAVLLIGGVSAFLFNTPYIPLIDRILGFLLPGVSLLFLAVKYGGVGGGDIKLTAAMGFCFGLYGITAILFFALVPACVYGKVTGQKSIPLAVFLCIGFFVYVGVSLLA